MTTNTATAYRDATAPYRDTVNQLLLTPRVFRRTRRQSRVFVFGFGWMMAYMFIVAMAWTMVLMFTVCWDFAVLVGVGVWFAGRITVQAVKARRNREAL